jgi:hypothetical protein
LKAAGLFLTYVSQSPTPVLAAQPELVHVPLAQVPQKSVLIIILCSLTCALKSHPSKELAGWPHLLGSGLLPNGPLSPLGILLLGKKYTLINFAVHSIA